MVTPSIRHVFSKLEQWCQYNFDPSDDALIASLSENIGLLENHPLYKGTFFAILRINPLEIVHLSSSAQKKYFAQTNITQAYKLMEMIDTNHLSFLSEAIGLIESYKNAESVQIPKTQISICGIKLWVGGVKKKVAVHVHYLMFNDKDIPLVAMIIVDDISVLSVAEHYWIRCVAINQDGSKGRICCFHKEESRSFDHDIVTERELLVLQSMKDGLDINTIADQLGISVNTVNNHKQNMYRRTGASNRTALIELAIMCGIL